MTKSVAKESTHSTKSGHPADVMILLDGSTSILYKTQGFPPTGGQLIGDGMEQWRKEKRAAIKLISALGRNLTDLEVGMLQFSGWPVSSHASTRVATHASIDNVRTGKLEATR